MKLLRTPVEVLLNRDIPELRNKNHRHREKQMQRLATIYNAVSAFRGPDPEETAAMLDADMALADLEVTMILMEREEKAVCAWREAYLAALESVLIQTVPKATEAEIAEMLALAESEYR